MGGLSRRDQEKHPRPSIACRYDLARRGHSRRLLSIVNPVNQLYLIFEIASLYPQLTSFSQKSRFSLTPVKVELNAIRAVPLPPFSGLAELRLKAYATRSHILSTDIARFYQSIYTHSIPWALHGKELAKLNRNVRDLAYYGNRLDFLVRQCQDGQTKGIPVGPDTSRIISELLLSAIDERADQLSGNKILAGYRYIDDVFYCFSSLVDAEAYLNSLRDAVHHYELELNPEKTRCQTTLSFNEETWPHKVAAMRIHRDGKSQRQSLFRYFSSMLEIAAGHSSESIAVFAIKATTTARISRENWDIYEAFLLRISREHTNTVDLVTKIICTYAAMGYPISPMVDGWVNDLLVTHVPANHHFEVSWALWAAISLERKLTGVTVDALSKTDNSVCALLALRAQELNLCEKSLATAVWFGNLSPQAFYEDRWLLLYEAIANGWLTSAPADMLSEPFFSTLLQEKVRFFLKNARNLPINVPGGDRILKGRRRRQRSSVLPGNIYVPKSKAEIQERLEFEELSGDYGDENGDIFNEYIDYDALFGIE
ncbi:RNA-directed DNA polymerase [Dongia soli]|uniref:RNA-directed DNA polymerase n=1 Tax=Dongia soli TaxID=600628 RepID=A0ABU5EH57_9PROT|nr:RNA-directed DNA polymerase [Dongia soli]MDY0885204.1 RNA-directed DNA polymerase [Dongia soli]